MLERADEWDVESAVAWLQRYAWGDGMVFQLASDARDDRVERFLANVGLLHAIMHNKPHQRRLDDDADEPIDVAGWPAIVPHLYA